MMCQALRTGSGWWRIVLLAVLVRAEFALAAAPAAPGPATQPAPAGMPDLSKYDATTLRLLATQLYQRVADLEAKVKSLQEQLDQARNPAQPGGAPAAPVAGRSTWVVEVTANTKPDLAAANAIQQQIRAEQRTLDSRYAGYVYGLNDAISHEQERYREAQAAKDYRSGRPKYTVEQLGEMRLAIGKLETEKKAIEARIRKLQADLDAIRTQQIVQGMLSDGTPVMITARGSLAATAAAMEVGQKYHVSGVAVRKDKALNVTPETIVAAK